MNGEILSGRHGAILVHSMFSMCCKSSPNECSSTTIAFWIFSDIYCIHSTITINFTQIIVELSSFNSNSIIFTKLMRRLDASHLPQTHSFLRKSPFSSVPTKIKLFSQSTNTTIQLYVRTKRIIKIKQQNKIQKIFRNEKCLHSFSLPPLTTIFFTLSVTVWRLFCKCVKYLNLRQCSQLHVNRCDENWPLSISSSELSDENVKHIKHIELHQLSFAQNRNKKKFTE